MLVKISTDLNYLQETFFRVGLHGEMRQVHNYKKSVFTFHTYVLCTGPQIPSSTLTL